MHRKSWKDEDKDPSGLATVSKNLLTVRMLKPINNHPFLPVPHQSTPIDRAIQNGLALGSKHGREPFRSHRLQLVVRVHLLGRGSSVQFQRNQRGLASSLRDQQGLATRVDFDRGTVAITNCKPRIEGQRGRYTYMACWERTLCTVLRPVCRSQYHLHTSQR